MELVTLTLNEKSSLKLLDEKDAEAIFLLTEKNRIRLRQYFPGLIACSKSLIQKFLFALN